MRSIALLFTLAASIAAEPVAKSFTASDRSELLYRIAAPVEIQTGKKYPLVIFLHGSGKRGNDNVSQLANGVNDILKNAIKLNQPTYLIAPQCPNGVWWDQVHPDKKESEEQPLTTLDAVIELTMEMISKEPIDPKRIYITGLSMGGFGTWSALEKKPNLFAAAIPICGGGNPEKVADYKHVPIQIFHGAADQSVLPLRSQKMHDALKAVGSSAKLTLYEGVGHDCWTQTYSNEEVIRWLFSQTKPD